MKQKEPKSNLASFLMASNAILVIVGLSLLVLAVSKLLNDDDIIMAGKYTRQNPNHPVNLFNEYRQEVKEVLRKKSNAELREHFSSIYSLDGNVPLARLPRGVLIQSCIKSAEQRYKKAWKERYGWDFDDVYDERKFEEHLKNMRAKPAEAEQEESQTETGNQ